MFECIQHPGEFISGLFSMRVNEAMKVLDIKDKKGLKGALSALMKSEEETQQKQIRFDYQDLNPASGGSRGSADKRNLVLANLLTNIKRNSEEGDKILMHPLT